LHKKNYLRNKMKIRLGDCLEEMRTMEDNSVDSIVTDPPYGLSFMGKKWDYDVPSIEIWKECLRVLKPGGYLLSFAGTRTQHRMAVNIEDAGFEIRDMIAWVYGSGFPKSHNIGKAVDKLQGNERKVIGEKAGTYADIRRDKETGEADLHGGQATCKPRIKCLETKGNSPYEGWGTALKPALEPITVARKPFKGTVANNVLKWGTGGINIDGCRVGTDDKIADTTNQNIKNNAYNGDNSKRERDTIYKQNPQGRFPANLIHDGSDEVVGLFPTSSTTGKRTTQSQSKNKKQGDSQVGWHEYRSENEYNDSGSAARFFYCAKASKSERNEGNNHPTVKPVKLMQYLVRLVTPKDGTVLDPFMGSGSTGIACKKEGFDFIGIELAEDYCNIAKTRIEKFKFQHELF